MHKVSSFSGAALFTVWVFVSVFFVFLSLAQGYIKGDIDNDGKIDLREAIHALQVVSGMKPSIDSKVINVPGDAATIQHA